MTTEVKTRRRYDTTLREEQAKLTRQRILDAARRRFVESGYVNVTMQDIARAAGVAYQTVYARFGSKLQLAIEMCTAEFPHVDETVAMLAETAHDPETLLRTMGTFARRLYEPCADVLRFMRESGDPDLLERYAAIARGRLDHLAALGPQLERSKRLRPGMSGAHAVDVVWTMAGPETYEHLVLDRGWTPKRFESWLGVALVDLLLAAER